MREIKKPLPRLAPKKGVVLWLGNCLVHRSARNYKHSTMIRQCPELRVAPVGRPTVAVLNPGNSCFPARRAGKHATPRRLISVKNRCADLDHEWVSTLVSANNHEIIHHPPFYKNKAGLYSRTIRDTIQLLDFSSLLEKRKKVNNTLWKNPRRYFFFFFLSTACVGSP